MVLPNPAGLSAEPAVRYPQQGGTIWIFFPNRRNEENLTNLERLQRAQSCTTHFICDCEWGEILCLKKQFSPSFFFLLEVILFFLNVIGEKKKQTQELMNILVKIIIIEPRRASCTEIRLFAILPPSKGACQPFSSWVL